jgi:ADP-ribose pyrophosphatase YjhB (NUDIX family)
MQRTIRYQAAVIRAEQILLIEHRNHASGHSYWLLPGGGREGDETAEACVEREIREETQLHVQVGQHLLDDPDMPGGTYQRLHTYLCHVVGGEAQPGYEPEDEAAEEYAISAVRWLDLRQPTTWEMDIQSDPITYPLLRRLRIALGYTEDATSAPGETA